MKTPEHVDARPAPPPAAPPPDARDPAAAAGAEHRLHPMSWLFVLLQQLKQFIVPLAALLFFGRGDRNELWPLIGVGVLVVTSLWQYFTYRYGVVGDSLVVRSGLFERSLRVIPFARIHNVELQQSLLHRVFDVAEVRLESAGGRKPEAQMRVLKLTDALALEALVRRTVQAGPAAEAAPDASVTLLTLSAGDVLRLGLVSNRGLIVVAAAVAAGAQFSPRGLPNGSGSNMVWSLIEGWARQAFGWFGANGAGAPAGPSWATYALAGASLLLAAVLALRLLSVALALLQYWGFTLSELDRRLTVERGLLARWRTSATRRRIQSWTLTESVLHRLFRRRGLEVDTAVSDEQQQGRALREIAPIATPAACDALIEHLLPHSGWATLHWTPLPPHAWRLFLPEALATLVACAAAGFYLGPWGFAVLAWLPVAALKAHRRAQRTAYAVNAQILAVREGWWSRHWRFAEIEKLQALHLSRSPMDRRCGTATLWLDTAGAGALSPPLRIRFMHEADARALYESLAATLAERPLRW